MSQLHEYTEEFFEYIERGSIASAKRLCTFLAPLLGVNSILDVGCGRGAWLREWRNAGVAIAQGVDGPYIRQQSLLIPVQDFTAVDLSKPFDLGRRYDLVSSLEVAEHLPRSSSESFISSLAAHADLVLFSAATPGQGGENHINERPLSFWQGLFEAEGYQAYDIVRPAFRSNNDVEPWYRFNTVLYANERARCSLPAAVACTRVESGRLNEIGDIGWRARRSILRLLPNTTVTLLSRWNYRRLNRAHKRRSTMR
jgi:SAM-dependent methyltransferase